MDPVIFIEVLSGRGDVEHRHRVTLPLRVGRSYQNDLILDDPFVDPDHAVIEITDDGRLVLNDLGSTNGISTGPHQPRLARVWLRSGDTARIGRTTIRVMAPEHPVPAAMAEAKGWAGLLHTLGRPRWSWALVFGTAAVFGWWTYLTTSTAERATDGFGMVFAVLFMVAFWAGGWALATRLRGKRFRFLQHAALASVAALVFAVWFEVAVYATFVTGRSVGWDLLGGVVGLGVATLAMYGHLALAGVRSVVRRWVGGGITVAVLGLLSYGVVEFEDEFFSSEVQIATVLKPVDPGLLVTVSLEEFFADTEGVRRRVDALAMSP